MKQRALALMAAVMAAHAVPSAQTDAEARMAAATTLRCTFPSAVRTEWKDGVPQPAVRRGNLVLEFREMKVDQGSAVLANGRTGKDLTMIAEERRRYFLDAGGGRVAATTVLAEFSTGTKLKATHTVHDYTALEIASFRSQPEVQLFLGDCDVTP